jgi:hypothetical protein
MIKATLKKITPDFILSLWRKYNENKERQRLSDLKRNIINYLESIPPENMDDEYQEVFDYLKCHPLSVFPYSYTEKYNSKDVAVYMDNDKKCITDCKTANACTSSKIGVKSKYRNITMGFW